MCDENSAKYSKGDEDMAIAQRDMKKRLENLKKRAKARKNNPNLKHSISQKSNERMNENAELLYQSQLNTIKETD